MSMNRNVMFALELKDGTIITMHPATSPNGFVMEISDIPYKIVVFCGLMEEDDTHPMRTAGLLTVAEEAQKHAIKLYDEHQYSIDNDGRDKFTVNVDGLKIVIGFDRNTPRSHQQEVESTIQQ